MSEPISTYYGLLRRIHELRQPSLYVEIGVHEGHSLAFVQPGTRIVGVDPEPKVTEPPADSTMCSPPSMRPGSHESSRPSTIFASCS